MWRLARSDPFGLKGLEVARALPLACGIVSSLLYLAMNVFVPLLDAGYSSVSQTVSELSAIGAPTRLLWLWLGTVYALLLVAFGWGVWKSAGANRPLRVVGGLLLADGILSLYWPPMQLRGNAFALTDALHIAWSVATVLLMTLAIGFGAAAFGTVYGVAGTVIQLSSAFGPALYGVARDLLGSYPPVLAIAAGFELAALAVVLAGSRR